MRTKLRNVVLWFQWRFWLQFLLWILCLYHIVVPIGYLIIIQVQFCFTFSIFASTICHLFLLLLKESIYDGTEILISVGQTQHSGRDIHCTKFNCLLSPWFVFEKVYAFNNMLELIYFHFSNKTCFLREKQNS